MPLTEEQMPICLLQLIPLNSSSTLPRGSVQELSSFANNTTMIRGENEGETCTSPFPQVMRREILDEITHHLEITLSFFFLLLHRFNTNDSRPVCHTLCFAGNDIQLGIPANDEFTPFGPVDNHEFGLSLFRVWKSCGPFRIPGCLTHVK